MSKEEKTLWDAHMEWFSKARNAYGQTWFRGVDPQFTTGTEEGSYTISQHDGIIARLKSREVAEFFYTFLVSMQYDFLYWEEYGKQREEENRAEKQALIEFRKSSDKASIAEKFLISFLQEGLEYDYKLIVYEAGKLGISKKYVDLAAKHLKLYKHLCWRRES